MRRYVRLHVNVDHVATVRQARRSPEPGVGSAAAICEVAGADGITVHLRGDRRHIQDADVRLLRGLVVTHLNLEMAATDEMVALALEARPDTVTLVPESPDEITTEGGLDLLAARDRVEVAVRRLREGEIDVSLFVEPEVAQIAAASEVGANQVELCTAVYAKMTERAEGDRVALEASVASDVERHAAAARMAAQLGLRVAAGHGLTYRNVHRIVHLPEVEELNIGHNIVARAIFVGLDRAVREMREAMDRALGE